ncbi:hypothetical protein ESY86_00490 [Subsaximicrobium wynnwilliamsii]|uniref:Uncharacterized protein n=1 Tax=Subsaximicrobium wynnwilliamsii TaxID=291179 RepID=A0A5C6ZNS5_9FLAO|nr:hypothetical protein [Subsaximicrobium wynnwilliamsii]TXD85064.1 hypothetical protein ESY87_01660 [Subsaximicrobium wynnwilliamsii]TXD91107.1 hypothetical protein ESY86_00490 [Subsaximicrobium wynnwilliamsii]TXE04501.1 hypothetical protein ESY88_03140 [Subsaximicrobium wynnwilliamsii]
MTQTITDYPIFEADQVLSQKHLNQLVSYLEEQDRLSRVYLQGMGIVCGLEISKPNATTIHVNCGTAITSLGFLIPFEENDYTQYKESTISEDFLAADVSKHGYLGTIYQWADEYAALSPCVELLSRDSEDDERQPLTNSILQNKIVMLLLESPLIDEKNCVTIDCADKGKRLELNVRVLLVDSELLSKLQFNLSNCAFNYLSRLKLPRFNVPKTNLITGNHIFNAFKAVINQSKKTLSESIQTVHQHFEPFHGNLENFSQLQNALTIINSMHQKFDDTLYIQYVWDWLNDMAATYNEISHYHACQLSICCPKQNDFPFHVLLGSAEKETASINHNNNLYNYRTHFINTGINSTEEKEKHEVLKGLLQKLIYQLGSFWVMAAPNQQQVVRITPSNIGCKLHSERAIPYYYTNIPTLNEYWSPILTQKALHRNILSYHADTYNTSNLQVNQPLLYDLECYDFFRIEGHIGQDYAEAITEIVALQETYRLPFKVVALNAVEYANQEIDISNQSGIWDDMELDYDLAKEKIYNITEYVITWIKTNKKKIQEHYPVMNDQSITNLESILKESRNLLVDDLKDFIPNYEGFYEVFENLNELFIMHRLCISLINKDDMHPVMEDLIDHFDEINNLFLEDPFTIINEEVQRRWGNSVKELFLTNFLQKHQGIDHEAGVPKGGTFILIYADTNIFKKPKPSEKNNIFIDRIVSYKKLFDFNEQQLEQVEKNNVVKKRARLKGKGKPEPENDKWLEEKRQLGKKFKAAMSQDNSKLPFATRAFIENQMNDFFDRNLGRIQVTDNTENKIPQRVIIADFYLPYICCGNGDSINIIINQEVDNEPIVADFDHRDFDENDFFTNRDNH